VAVISGVQKRKDADGEFIRDICGLKFVGAGFHLVCVSAGGKVLAAKGQPRTLLQRALAAWNRLPASEKRPGAVRVGERGPIDTKWALPEPPPGGLILKLYYRTLASDGRGGFQHVTENDFLGHNLAEQIKDLPIHRGERRLFTCNKAFQEANPDFLWLTKSEWKSLIPANPRQGDTYPAPAAVRERIFRFHLHPVMAFGEHNGWNRKAIRGGRLTLTVEDVSPATIRFRLSGYALLGPDFDTVQKMIRQRRAWYGYEPALLGHLDYDRKAKRITRFDLIALGDTYGLLPENGCWLSRPGRNPLAVGFELVSGDVPADRVPPRSAKSERLARVYFATGQ
jgi:hypothetical protein